MKALWDILEDDDLPTAQSPTSSTASALIRPASEAFSSREPAGLDSLSRQADLLAYNKEVEIHKEHGPGCAAEDAPRPAQEVLPRTFQVPPRHSDTFVDDDGYEDEYPTSSALDDILKRSAERKLEAAGFLASGGGITSDSQDHRQKKGKRQAHGSRARESKIKRRDGALGSVVTQARATAQVQPLRDPQAAGGGSRSTGIDEGAAPLDEIEDFEDDGAEEYEDTALEDGSHDDGLVGVPLTALICSPALRQSTAARRSATRNGLN